MGAGKVDFKNLWKNAQQSEKRIRWRTLQGLHTGALVSIYGYPVQRIGEQGVGWFGYTLADLPSAPCVHCGQKGVFLANSWEHECPGFYDGHRLPCAQGIPALETSHPCRGEPSMSYAGPAYDTSDGLSARETGGPSYWRSTDWKEVEIATSR